MASQKTVSSSEWHYLWNIFPIRSLRDLLFSWSDPGGRLQCSNRRQQHSATSVLALNSILMATQVQTRPRSASPSASYLLDFLGLGWVRARRSGWRRRNVLCDCQELLFQEMHRFSVASHSLGAMANSLCEGKPPWRHKDR